MKDAFTVLFTMFLWTIFPVAAFATFPDIPASLYQAVSYVESQGVVSGYPDGTFRPNIPVNRAEFTKIITLYKFGQQMVDQCGTRMSFGDVRTDAWYTKYVCRAKDAHLIDGYSDGTFHPERSINIAEAAKIIARTDTFNAGDPKLPADTGGPWYEIYTRYLSQRGAMPAAIVSYDVPLTRGQMAEILYRLYLARESGVQNLESASQDQADNLHDCSGLTGKGTFRDSSLGVCFSYDPSWPIPILSSEPGRSNGGFPWQNSDKKLFIGPVCKGCAEGDDMYPFTLERAGLHFMAGDEATLAKLTPEHEIFPKSDTTQGDVRTIVFSEGGICGDLVAVLLWEGQPITWLRGRCADDNARSRQQFYDLLSSLRLTSVQWYR